MFSLVSRKFLAMRNIALYSVPVLQLNICYCPTLVRFVKIFMISLGVESVVRELRIPVCATTFFEWCASMVFLLWKDMLNLNMSDLVKKNLGGGMSALLQRRPIIY